MIQNLFITILISSATLSACATTSNKAADTSADLSSLKQSMLAEKPNVIISRIGSPPMALASRVKVNGTEVARLMMGQYTEFHLEPGDHDIAVRYNPLSGQRGDDITLTVEESRTYAFDIGGGLSVSHKGGMTLGAVKVKLKQRDPESLTADLERCCAKVELQPR